jgi:uncharacterized protein (TIGR02452 family)
MDANELVASARKDERIDYRGDGGCDAACPGGDPFKGMLQLPRLAAGTGEWDVASASFDAPLLNVMVVDADCLQVMSMLQDRPDNLNVAVLNMANATTPGGGYVNGAGAQEESIFRRCSLRLHLDCKRSNSRRLYPIPEIGAVYSPAVALFRAPESDDYSFLRQPRPFACISAAAYNRPRLLHKKGSSRAGSSSEAMLAPREEQDTLLKIGAILRCALEKGHDCVVLGALGTGAFKNPAKHVAALFKRALETPVALAGLSTGATAGAATGAAAGAATGAAAGAATGAAAAAGANMVPLGSLFRCIVFAIIADQNSSHSASPDGNLRPFAELFQIEDLDMLSMLSLPDIRPVTAATAGNELRLPASLIERGPLSLIFLDIDGVLLPFGNDEQDSQKFPRRCLDALAKVLQATGAVVVLSSTWRSTNRAQADIIEQFVQHGAVLSSLETIGINKKDSAFMLTTALDYHNERQQEIAHFLENADSSLNIRSWVALDDEELLLEPRNQRHRQQFEGHVVKTESRCGLTDRDADKAIAALNQGSGWAHSD